MRIYKILTDRLTIRCYELKDAEKYMIAVKNSVEELKPWMSWVEGHPVNLDGNIEMVRKFRGNFDIHNDYKYAIFDKDENFVGNVGIHYWHGGKGQGREVGYWIDTKHAGKGYATEAVKAVIKVLFEVEKYDKIIIKCKLENVSSIKIPEKLKFSTVAYKDSTRVLFRLTKEDYINTELPQFSVKAFDGIDREFKPSGIKIDPPVTETKEADTKDTKDAKSDGKYSYRNYFNNDFLKRPKSKSEITPPITPEQNNDNEKASE